MHLINMSCGSKDSDMLQLKQILINGIHSGDMQLKLLTEFETSRSLKDFEILTRISELIPLAKSILMIKKIISAFARKLVSLLEERNVLHNAESSQNILECLKKFWSLCSRQQNVISSSRCFGKWHPILLEEITPLASLFIDLFISAHGHCKNKMKWSKKLYSWLNFDLPDRAIRIALLEAEGHGKEGAEIVGPLLSHILRRKTNDLSDADYLLHFLLLKKWQGLAVVSDLLEESKLIKAPPTFLPWVKTYLKDGCHFIPEDTTMMGASVSQFLMDLNTCDVLEPLTDVLQIALFPENIEVGPMNTDVSSNHQFVVDKKGMEQFSEIKMNEDDDLSDCDDRDAMINSGWKKAAVHEKTRGIKDRRSMEKAASSPSKKKLKKGEDEPDEKNADMTGFFMDRGHAKPKNVDAGDEESKQETYKQTISSDGDHEEPKSGKRKRSLANEKSDVDDDGDVERMTKRRRESDNENDVEATEEEGENRDYAHKRKLRSRNLATAVLKRKNILISDPVASSYFTGDAGSNLTDSESSETPSGNTNSNTSLLSSPIDKAVRSSPRISKIKGVKCCLHEEGISPVQRKTSQRQKHESPQVQRINESLKKQTRNESPKKPKNSSTPQKQIITKSLKKTGVN